MKLEEKYILARDYILSIPKFAKKIGTEELSILLGRLGHPEKKYKVIHIAGTNGKGSVTTMISGILENMGYKTGVFTSPHLNKMNERIRVKGQDISDEGFVEIYELMMEKISEHMREGYQHPSFFEVVFIMAAMFFEKEKVDVAIFETGMGGRLDATNILIPEVSVITSIGLDHMQFLGDTIEKIAYEKAGIIKAGIPVITNTGDSAADRVIRDTCEKLKCKWIPVNSEEVKVSHNTNASGNADNDNNNNGNNSNNNDSNNNNGINFSLCNSFYRLEGLKLNVKAIYQADNAATAVLSAYTFLSRCEIYDASSFDMAVREALSGFYWTGRFEEVLKHVFIDGAHNLDAVIRFTEAVKNYCECESIENLNLLFAVSSDKNYESMLQYITDNLNINRFYVTEYHSDRSLDTDKVVSILEEKKSRLIGEEKKGFEIIRSKNPRELIDIALEEIDNKTALFIFGSLYLVGEIKAILER